MRWLLLLAAMLAIILLPLIFFEAQIAAISLQAVETARNEPLLVAAIIILALALDVFLPVPNGVTNTLAGAVFGFAVGGLVIWLGMMAASLLGYGVGAIAGRPLARKMVGDDDLHKAENFAARYGVVALILTRLVPIAAELATIGAGMSAMPLRMFLFVTSLSNLGVAMVYAAIGSAAIAAQSTGMILLGTIGLPLMGFSLYRYYEYRNREDR